MSRPQLSRRPWRGKREGKKEDTAFPLLSSWFPSFCLRLMSPLGNPTSPSHPSIHPDYQSSFHPPKPLTPAAAPPPPPPSLIQGQGPWHCRRARNHSQSPQNDGDNAICASPTELQGPRGRKRIRLLIR